MDRYGFADGAGNFEFLRHAESYGLERQEGIAFCL